MRTCAIITVKIISFLLLVSGCTMKEPTIAHTHIGHAMDGWASTPNQVGLFPAAEASAQDALQAVEAARSSTDLLSIKFNIYQVLSDINPEVFSSNAPDGKAQYGVKNALAQTVQHILFAAESPDASANVRSSAIQFSNDSSHVLARCDLIVLLCNEILASTSADEASILSGELLKLSRANLEGDDLNGDGIIGSTPEEYGLKQLREELVTMIDREVPAYTTVGRWYLFNLIRLDSGEWAFKKREPSGYNGGSGGY